MRLLQLLEGQSPAKSLLPPEPTSVLPPTPHAPALCGAIRPSSAAHPTWVALLAHVRKMLAKLYCIPVQLASSAPCVFCVRLALLEAGQGKGFQQLDGPTAEVVMDVEHCLWQLHVCSL